MSKVDFYASNIEWSSISETKNIFSEKSSHLYNIKAYSKNLVLLKRITKAIDDVVRTKKPKLIIKKFNNWIKFFLNNKRKISKKYERNKIKIIKYWKYNYIDTSKYDYKLFISLTIERYINVFFDIIINYYETPLFDAYNKTVLNIHESFIHNIGVFCRNKNGDNSDIINDAENNQLIIKLKEEEKILMENHPLLEELDNFYDPILKDMENKDDEYNNIDIEDNGCKNQVDNNEEETCFIIKFK